MLHSTRSNRSRRSDVKQLLVKLHYGHDFSATTAESCAHARQQLTHRHSQVPHHCLRTDFRLAGVQPARHPGNSLHKFHISTLQTQHALSVCLLLDVSSTDSGTEDKSFAEVRKLGHCGPVAKDTGCSV